jgi:hypothetical protein
MTVSEKRVGAGMTSQPTITTSTGGVLIDMSDVQSQMLTIVNSSASDDTRAQALNVAADANDVYRGMVEIAQTIQAGLTTNDIYSGYSLAPIYDSQGNPYMVFGNLGPSYANVRARWLIGTGTVYFSGNDLNSSTYFINGDDTTLRDKRAAIKRAANAVIAAAMAELVPSVGVPGLNFDGIGGTVGGGGGGGGNPPSGGGGGGGGSSTLPIRKHVQLPTTNKQVIGIQVPTGGGKGLPGVGGGSGGDPWQQSRPGPSQQGGQVPGGNGPSQIGGGEVDPQHDGGPQPSGEGAPKGGDAPGGGDSGGFAEGQVYGSDGGTIATFDPTTQTYDTSGATSSDDTMEVYNSDGDVAGIYNNTTDQYYTSGSDDSGANTPSDGNAGSNDNDPKGGGSNPNPDDGTDESGRMRGLPRYVRRQADKFTGKGAVPAQTSLVYRLLAFSSQGLGEDGGGVNPRFFGADPGSDRSSGRSGRAADPDSGGGGNGLGYSVGANSVNGGDTIGGMQGPVDMRDQAAAAALTPTGPDPDNEWGAGGYNPHYQPAGYAWTPYSRGATGGATRAVPSLHPTRAPLMVATRFS